MTIFTKLASAIFAALDSSGILRRVDNAEVVQWGTEVERLLSTGGFKTIDAQGPFSGRAAYNAQPKGFTYLSVDGDGASIPFAVGFIKKSATSGDWSVAIPFQGPAGEAGPAGEGFTPAGAWDAGTSYAKNDMVSFGGRSFVSFAAGNLNNEPPNADTDDAHWQFVPAAVGPEGPQGPVGNTGAAGLTGATGATGATGPANTLAIGTVTQGAAGASITGTAPNQTLNLTLPKGDTGTAGNNGWTAVLAVVSDGARRVHRVIDWTGGAGSKPATGKYVGASGLVDAIGDGVDIRGAAGAGTGDVVGPAGATADRIAVFDGVTGKLLKDGGKTVDELVPANGSVTNTKLANMATARIKGRATAADGSPEDLTLTQVLDMIGSAAEGDMLFRGASAWLRLPKGTAGQFLKQNTTLTGPEWVTVAQREVLAAARTYYVRTDGNDGNTGLANTSGGAFKTIQKALDVTASLDMAIYDVTIQIGAGTYTQSVNTLKQCVGSGHVFIVGDEVTPANVVLENTGANNHQFTADTVTTLYHIRGLRLTNPSGNIIGILVRQSHVFFRNVDFGAFVGTHFDAQFFGILEAEGDWSISGGAGNHMRALTGGILYTFGRTVTISGSPSFSASFIRCDRLSVASCQSMTFVGAATGKRYDVTLNSVILTTGAGASYFPGSVAGTTATGGQYA